MEHYMATSKVTPDADAIVSEIFIAAMAERVFQALVDPQKVVRWWGQPGIYRCTQFQADLRLGGQVARRRIGWQWSQLPGQR
jgi:uncharacterized protein YndB with AHSA1/START domain